MARSHELNCANLGPENSPALSIYHTGMSEAFFKRLMPQFLVKNIMP